MTAEEKRFLSIMDEIWAIAECWRTRCGVRQLKDDRTYTYESVDSIVRSMENNLSFAGSILGLRCRFYCTASKRDWQLTIQPKNGHANLMMQRYFQLFTERELNDECGV